MSVVLAASFYRGSWLVLPIAAVIGIAVYLNRRY